MKRKDSIFPDLALCIEELIQELALIPKNRLLILDSIAHYVQEKKRAGEESNLIFICTHNSRRSHLSQIWAQTAAYYFGLNKQVHTYSGGTEVTAFHPRALKTLQKAGFKIDQPEGDNPHYPVQFAQGEKAFPCFSKRYDDPANPQNNFLALMTCSDADQNCPIIPGVDLRISIPYEDPKVSDGTEKEEESYEACSRQIAREMFYCLSRVNL